MAPPAAGRPRHGAASTGTGAAPAGGYDLLRHGWLARWLKAPSWQFQMILPNQILFWVVIVVGLVGTSDPELNFATAITWYVWFCLVFVLILATGRGWCAVCPFGGLAEWVQRRALWSRGGVRRPIGLGLAFPERVGRYGYLLPVATFGLLTWIEEFFEIAGPGDPPLTSALVVGLIVFALGSFLVFERRTFCRYLCPLSGLIGTLGAQAPLAGFAARDPQVCRDCTTKDCLRGNENGYGCPWFTWPGDGAAGLHCGLCGECFRTCPAGNVGLVLKPPLAGLLRPSARRADVAWAVACLAGIVVYQQLNATAWYTAVDDGLNALTGVPHYPNPVGYLGVIALVGLLAAVPAWSAARRLLRQDLALPVRGSSFVYGATRFRVVFVPLMYAAIPLVGSDYLARQLPKFLDNAAKVIPAAARMLGAVSAADSPPAAFVMADQATVVAVQLVVVAAGTLASMVAAYRISRSELAVAFRAPVPATAAAVALMAAGGGLIGWLFVLIQAAE